MKEAVSSISFFSSSWGQMLEDFNEKVEKPKCWWTETGEQYWNPDFDPKNVDGRSHGNFKKVLEGCLRGAWDFGGAGVIKHPS
jgi:hypothetical protein